MSIRKRTLLELNIIFLASGGIQSMLIGGVQLYVYLERFGANHSKLTWVPFVLFPFMLAVVLLAAALLLKKNNLWMQKTINQLLAKRTSATIVFLLLSILIIVLLSRTMDLNNAAINLGMSWLGVLFYALLINLLVFTGCRQIKDKKADSYLVLAISLACIALAWLFMTLTGIGLQPDQAFWNVAGVPMMWVSLASIVLMILIVHEIVNWIKTKKGWNPDPKLLVLLEIFLVLGIWLIASLVWIKTPYSNSYFLLGPLPPDGYYLPKSDAKLMDLGGQYLIIGGRLETPYYTEKPFYALFLGLLHLIFGQSYQTITNIQIILLALFPVLLYFFGKRLSGKLFGIALALFAIIKETTAILFTFKISVSNSRLMMTEFPTAFLLLLLAFLLFIWLREQKNELALPLLSGGVLGLSIFIRSNNLVVFPIILVFLFLTGIREIKTRVPQILIFLLGVMVMVLPWTVYNQVTYGKDPITWKVQAALATRFSVEQVVDGRNEAPTAATATLPQVPETDETVSPSELEQSSEVTGQPNLDISNEPGETGNTALYGSKITMVLGHFLNNQVKSLFVLPFQIYPARPTNILEQEYWHEPVTWNGQMPAEHVIAFIFNLILISLGVQYAYTKFKWAGLVPLVLQMSYYLSNALVRTSGSRYLLPVDWVVYLYFLLGLWCLLRAINLIPQFKPAPVRDSTGQHRPNFWISLTICLLIGLSLPVLNLAFPTLYHNDSKSEVYQRLPMEKIEEEIGITPSQMEDFFNKPNTLFLYGKEIYPAYLDGDNGPIDKGLRFTLLTPTMYEVVIPYGIDLEERLPDGEDMIALGCKYPGSDQVITYLVYFVQSDQLIWSTSTTFRDICQ